MSGTGATDLDLTGMPSLDLRTEPKTWSTATEVKNRARHVVALAQVLAHGVAVLEPEDASDLVRVNQIIDEDTSADGRSLHLPAEITYARGFSVWRAM